MSIKHGLVLILLAVVAGLAALPAPARADDLTIYSSLPLNTPERAIYEDIVRGERPALEQAGRMAGPHTVRLVSLNDASDRGGWDPGLTARNAALTTARLRRGRARCG